jgi:hypothetical protein
MPSRSASAAKASPDIVPPLRLRYLAANEKVGQAKIDVRPLPQ